MDSLYFLGQSLFYDALILSSVSWLLKQKLTITRFTLAIAISLITSLLLYLTVPFLIFIVPFITIRIAFSPQPLKQYSLSIVYFYGMTAFLSGILHMLRYFVNFDLLNTFTFLLLGVIIAITLAVTFLLKFQFVKEVYTLGEFEHQVTFYCGDIPINGVGFVDTGNILVDKKTQLPVMIVPWAKVTTIKNVLMSNKIRTWEVDFSTIGTVDGVMTVFAPTLLLIDDVIVKEVVIGLSDLSFQNYDFLLQPEITIGRGVI